MSRYAAVLDACVLVPIALADTLLRVAEKGLYRPLWSDRILAEAQEATEEIHPGIGVDKCYADMRGAFGDALVTGWEPLEAGIVLPDEDDRHVVAAAIQAGAQAVVTFNLRDFPARTLSHHGLEVIHPDAFLLDQLDLSPPTVLQALTEQADHTTRPRLSSRELIVLLSRAGVPGFADQVQRLLDRPLGSAT